MAHARVAGLLDWRRCDRIVIRRSDPGWPDSFERARQQLTPVLGAWTVRDVEHIGSTAVPGLPAKAIIDMLAVVVDVQEAHQAIGPMQRVGWIHAPEPEDAEERQLSFCFPSIERRTHHLHVVEARSAAWRGRLTFSDSLCSHDDAARDYARLKTRLAREHGDDPDDRTAYRAGKAEFVRRITDLACGTDPPESR